MLLPRGEEAVVDHRKVADYVLSSTHPVGANKARVFRSALGLTAQGAPLLVAELRKAATSAEAVEGLQDKFGRRYQIDFEMAFDGRSAWVRSAWLLPSDGSAPTFLTAYVLLGSS